MSDHSKPPIQMMDDILSNRDVKNLGELNQKIRSYFPSADLKVVQKAYEFSEKAHEGQIRRSGEPYFSHPLAVAGILADLNLDLDTVATGLLHDTLEDTAVTSEVLRREFGETVATLVEGVTKISKLNFKTSTERQGENIRKMIIAMGKDVRILLVKLADRLHNMRTLNHMPYEKQAQIAGETLEIYCPLASRMGISALKIELEDLSFRYSNPEMFYFLYQKTQKMEKSRLHFIEEVEKIITKELTQAGVQNFSIHGRFKHLYSVFRKMSSRSIDYEQVYDILAFRVLVDTVSQCYEVLGHIHSLWKPIPGRFKDFIAMPKMNNYRSLHTTLVGPSGERIEVQIRTKEMHQVAERGIAAHWKYKERGKIDDTILKQSEWLKELVAWHQQVRSPEEFLDTVKTDLFESEIYIFTPKGDLKEFPEGATPIDFAYAVHTEVGHHCVGARVNGRSVPLKYKLKNGDTVDIMTSHSQTPSKDWLKMCVTTKAKSKIRAFVKEEQRKGALALGKDLVDREFRKFGAASSRYLKGEEMEKLKRDMGLHDDSEVFVRVGYGKVEPRFLVERLARSLVESVGGGTSHASSTNSPSSTSSHSAAAATAAALSSLGTASSQTGGGTTFFQRAFRNATQKIRKTGSLVMVHGMQDVLVYYAKCCHPIPGDPISGFITRGRGITIHRSDCRKAFEFDQDRQVEVQWTQTASSSEGVQGRTVRLQIHSVDSPGLLRSMTEAFTAHGVNIENAAIRTNRDGRAISTFEVSVKNKSHLTLVITDLKKIKGILDVQRLTGT